jgi:hypothetical protein
MHELYVVISRAGNDMHEETEHVLLFAMCRMVSLPSFATIMIVTQDLEVSCCIYVKRQDVHSLYI